MSSKTMMLFRAAVASAAVLGCYGCGTPTTPTPEEQIPFDESTFSVEINTESFGPGVAGYEGGFTATIVMPEASDTPGAERLEGSVEVYDLGTDLTSPNDDLLLMRRDVSAPNGEDVEVEIDVSEFVSPIDRETATVEVIIDVTQIGADGKPYGAQTAERVQFVGVEQPPETGVVIECIFGDTKNQLSGGCSAEDEQGNSLDLQTRESWSGTFPPGVSIYGGGLIGSTEIVPSGWYDIDVTAFTGDPIRQTTRRFSIQVDDALHSLIFGQPGDSYSQSWIVGEAADAIGANCPGRQTGNINELDEPGCARRVYDGLDTEVQAASQLLNHDSVFPTVYDLVQLKTD